MSAECTLSVVAARPAVAALRERGIDPGPALSAARLSPEALASIDNRLPHSAVRDLWEAAAQMAKDSAFGLHVAQTRPTGAFDLFDYLFSVSENVGEGLRRVMRYIRLLHDRSHFELVVEPKQARIVRRVPATAPQWDEFSLSLLLVRSRQATGVEWRPEHVVFQHERAVDDGEARRLFGCAVEFGAMQGEMRVAPSVLELPHTRKDPGLLELLGRQAESQLAALPPEGTLLTRVSSSIAQRIARQIPSLDDTATAVRLPTRTLQRALAAEGTSHSTLVDEVRRSLALKYIRDAGVTVGEIAYLLHFTDATAFHRAFRRWTGETPTQYRKRLF